MFEQGCLRDPTSSAACYRTQPAQFLAMRYFVKRTCAYLQIPACTGLFILAAAAHASGVPADQTKKRPQCPSQPVIPTCAIDARIAEQLQQLEKSTRKISDNINTLNGTISTKIDGLTNEVKGVSPSSATPWVAAVLGFVGGLLIAFFNKVYFDRQKRDELTAKVIDDFLVSDFVADRRGVDALLRDVSKTGNSWTDDEKSDVLLLGSRYEIIALLLRRETVDPEFLEKSGIIQIIKDFHARYDQKKRGGDFDHEFENLKWLQLKAFSKAGFLGRIINVTCKRGPK